MPKNRNYWAVRYDQVEQAANNVSVEYAGELEKKYKRAAHDIDAKINVWYQRLADNNGVTAAAAREMLNDSELEEFKWNVEEYIKRGEENAINKKWVKELENASAKFHIRRLEALKIEVRQQIEQVAADNQKEISDVLGEVYKESFYRSCFELQKGIGIGFDVAQLDNKLVSKVLLKPWAVDGINFSERIWNNKAKLINSIDQELSRMVLAGESPRKTVQNIRKMMNTSLFNARRLVFTEQAYFTTLAQNDSYKELDVEEYEIVATLDKRTSEVCQDMDGKHFSVSEMTPGVNAPPFHPLCRSTTCPYFNDEFTIDGMRAARNDEGKTYYVPADMTYKEWKEVFVDGGSKDEWTPVDIQPFDSNEVVTDSAKDFSSVAYGSKDITQEWLSKATSSKNEVTDIHEFVQDGVRYTVDGKHVVLDYKENEKHIAEVLHNELGSNISMMPKVNEPTNVKTPDYLIDGKRFDLKSPTGSGKEVLFGMVKGKREQADNFVFDISNCPLTVDNLVEQAKKLFTSRHTRFVDSIILIKDDEILLILQRN